MVRDVEKRPENEFNRRNRNVAFLYVYLRGLNELLPTEEDYHRETLIKVGLDPDYVGEDLDEPAGIGMSLPFKKYMYVLTLFLQAILWLERPLRNSEGTA